MGSLVLVGPTRSLASALRRRVETADLVEVADADSAAAVVRGTDDVDVVVIGTHTPDPVGAARRVHASNGDVSVVIVTPATRREAVARQLQRVPIGGDVRCVSASASAERVRDDLDAAILAAQQRRRERSALVAANGELQRAAVPARQIVDLLDHAPIGVLGIDDRGVILVANRSANALLGAPAPVIGARLHEVLPGADVDDLLAACRDTGTDIAQAMVPVARGVLDVRAVNFTVPGVPALAVLLLSDATERALAEAEREDAVARLAFMASVGPQLFDAATDHTSVLRRVASLTVPTFADWCSLYMVGADGTIEYHALRATSDPARERLAVDMEAAAAANRLAPGHPAMQVMASGEPLLVPEITDAFLWDACGHDPTVYAHARDVGLRSVLALPLRVRGRTIGVVTFAMAESGRHYHERDLALGEDLAVRIALAVDNATLFRTVQEAQRRFRGLVESIDAVVWEVDAAARRFSFVSARTEELLGYPASRWLDEPEFWVEVVHPDDRDRVVAFYQVVRDHGSDERIEYRMRASDGRTVWVRDLVRVERADDGSATRLRGVMVDITDRRAAELRQQALHESMLVLADEPSIEVAAPALLQVICSLLDWTHGALWLIDPATTHLTLLAMHSTRPLPTFTAASQGRTFPRGVGLPGRVWEAGEPAWIRDLATDGNFPRAAAAGADGLRSAFAFPIAIGGRVIGVLEFFTHEDRLPDHDLLTTMATAGGQIGQFIERTRVEAALRFQRALLQSQNEATLDATLVISDDGRVLSYNQRLLEISSLPEQVLREGTVRDLLAWARTRVDPPGDASDFALARSDMSERRRVVTADGRIFDRYSTPLRSAEGERYGRAWYFRDITQESRREEALRESSARFAHLARTLQASLLPPHLPEIDGVDLAARYEPGGEGDDVGGDFYDIFERDRNDWAIVVGDVCGKGPEAAAVTALARYTVRAGAMRAGKPSRILAMLSEAVLRQRDDGRFCTLAYARLRFTKERIRLTVSVGGHPPPLVLRSSGVVTAVGVSGTLLGLFPDPDLHDQTVDLQPGDAVVLYTDGVTEARRGAELFGAERLAGALMGQAGQPAGVIADRVLDAVRAFRDGRAADDVALIVARITG